MNELALITGGSKGIGKALIEHFAGHGFDIITCSRNEKDLQELKKNIEEKHAGVQVHCQKVDLTIKQEVDQFVAFCKDLSRPIAVLINNAGSFIPGQIYDEEDGALEKMISVNLYSAYNLTRGLIDDMIEQRSGHIFNMCSIASIIAYKVGGSYCISKHALLGMSKVLREEMKEYNIRVTAVLPGATLTDSWAGVDLPAERFMKPEDVAAAVYSAYAISKRSVVEELLIRPQLGDF
ncbi:MAG: SDR family NAD(P)-dependent oxidoreductase [Cyclobacteriaceae bacterium]